MKPVVFLHIPKTAGQTIHSELTRVVGESLVSPVRVHTQAQPGKGQFPKGYQLYSGHLDWDGLDAVGEDRFVFTVFRDPAERIASFYFYLLEQAGKLTEDEIQKPARTGMRRVLNSSVDEYFFDGDSQWERFVRDHYDNVYTHYLASRKLRGWYGLRNLPVVERLALAKENAKYIDLICTTKSLDKLESSIELTLGSQIGVVGKYVNQGRHERNELRWPKLLDMIESDSNRRRLEAFVEVDIELINDLGLAT